MCKEICNTKLTRVTIFPTVIEQKDNHNPTTVSKPINIIELSPIPTTKATQTTTTNIAILTLVLLLPTPIQLAKSPLTNNLNIHTTKHNDIEHIITFLETDENSLRLTVKNNDVVDKKTKPLV